MTTQNQDGMQCAEFEALLSDALDQFLTGEKLESFRAHARSCSLCGPLFAEVEEGHRLLKHLSEAEPPAELVNGILAATTGIDTLRLRGTATANQSSWFDRMRDWAGVLLSPVVAMAKQPRFAMSFGMAFFSLSISMSLAGVKLSDVRHADLRPSAIKRTYYETSGKVVKYYENIRFVYEMESRVREFKRAVAPAEPSREQKERDRKNNTSERPDEKQERNYSQGESQFVLAALTDHPPVVKLATLRRFV